MKKLSQAVLMIALLVACAGEATMNQEDFKPELLNGKWELLEASRNGVVTGTLKDVFFEFKPPNVLETNVPTIEGVGTYTLDDLQLTHTLSDKSVDYDIKSLTDSLLLIETKLQGFKFEFSLERSFGE